MPVFVQLPGEQSFMWTDLAQMRSVRLLASDLPGLLTWLRWGGNHPDAAGRAWRLRLCQSLIRAQPSLRQLGISAAILNEDIPGLKEAALVPAHDGDQDTLASLWRVRDHLLAVPNLWSGLLEGHPLGMRHASPVMSPIINRLTTAILAHAAEGIATLRQVDRAITHAWGYPVMKKAWSISLAQLERAGLELEVFVE